MDYSEINFKKKFGQNFLKDKNLLLSIVKDADIMENDVVLEIGAGAGALTQYLVKSAKRVVSFEIDTELKDELNNRFENVDNIEFIFEDFLNCSEEKILGLVGENYKVVANLPYYITSPILTKLFSLKYKPQTIVVMVQKEVGERIVATNKDSQYGYFSAFITANANAKITRQVNRKMFTPVPNVDSCVVRLDVKNNNYDDEFFNFLKNCFHMKRKTIVNNIEKSYNINKAKIVDVFDSLNINVSSRADSLNLDTLFSIYKQIFK